MFIVKGSEQADLSGFRALTDEEVLKDFKKIDLDGSGFITKNEWIIYFVSLLSNDIVELEKEGANSIMKRIYKLSKEFDKYDVDKNGYLDFLEFKEFIQSWVYISK